jgi:hypothetical protein
MCRHLFTWTPEVKVIAPDGLRHRYLEMLEAARVSIGNPGGTFLDQDPGGPPFIDLQSASSKSLPAATS